MLSEANDTVINNALRIYSHYFEENTATRLTGILSHYGCTALPNPRNLADILRLIAFDQTIAQPFFAIHHMRLGMETAHRARYGIHHRQETAFSGS